MAPLPKGGWQRISADWGIVTFAAHFRLAMSATPYFLTCLRKYAKNDTRALPLDPAPQTSHSRAKLGARVLFMVCVYVYFPHVGDGASYVEVCENFVGLS